MNVQQRMQAAHMAFSKGDATAAKVHGQAALKARPKDALILQFMGVICCQSGDPKMGADYLRKAIANGGDNEDNRINLAKALTEIGEFDAALDVCAPDGDPPTPDLQRMHAEILKIQGRPSEAMWVYEKLVYERPDDFGCWNNLGTARLDTGDVDGALEAFQKARELDPKSPLVHTNLARALMAKDRYEDACFMLEKAALLAPEDPAPLIELGRALTNIDHAEAGLRALGTAARLNPKDPDVFVAIGLAFTDMADQLQAERAYKFAVQADPAYPAGYLNLGMLFEKANRVEELDALIANAKRAGAQGTEIDYLRALSLSRKGDSEAALEILRTIGTKAIHPATLAQFKGQLADKLGQIDEAYYAYEDMNQAMATSPLGVGKDRTAYQRDIESLNATTTAQWYAGWPKVDINDGRASPAFLVGFPRSGTTLLDTILMGHSGVHVLEEIPLIETVSHAVGDLDAVAHMDQAKVAEMRALYFAELDKASPSPPGKLVIDKNPLSMIRMPLIHRLFPDAKIILAMRHPCDVVLSCYMQNFKPTQAMSSFLDLTNAARTYDRIFAYWEKSCEVLPLNTHMLRYEAMVDDVEAAVRPLFEFLGLPWENQVLDHQKTAKDRGYIRTPSYAQVTEKIYSSASGRWQRYRSQMTEVLPILEPWIDRFGYKLD
jgi:tetratricopeptide (TPR) repeat protein